MTRPQFGSSPAIAVFTNGEFATDKAIFFASISFLHLLTFIVINFDAPSPSETILLPNSKEHYLKPCQNFLFYFHLYFSLDNF